jgi:hypothetical protein
MKLDRSWKSAFSGSLGLEINKIADAIRAAQIIPAAGVRTAHTSTGTIVTPEEVPSSTTVAATTAVVEWHKIVAPTAAELSQLENNEGIEIPTGYDVATWSNDKELMVLGQPCDVEGNEIEGREAERNWVIKPPVNHSDSYSIDSNNNPLLDDWSLFENRQLFRLPEHYYLYSRTNYTSHLKLTKDYVTDDIILTSLLPIDDDGKGLLMRLGDSPFRLDYRIYAKYYDLNLAGRFWVRGDFPTIT